MCLHRKRQASANPLADRLHVAVMNAMKSLTGRVYHDCVRNSSLGCCCSPSSNCSQRWRCCRHRDGLISLHHGHGHPFVQWSWHHGMQARRPCSTKPHYPCLRKLICSHLATHLVVAPERRPEMANISLSRRSWKYVRQDILGCHCLALQHPKKRRKTLVDSPVVR